MVKASDSAFEAAKTAYTGYGWLLQEVAKDAGWDKAIAINASTGDRVGQWLGSMVRAKCGEQKPDAASIAAGLEDAYRRIGIDYEVQASDAGVTNRVERCPFYEGLAASGIDHATIQQLCQAFADREFKQLKGLVSGLTGKLKFRESASDTCFEEFVPAK